MSIGMLIGFCFFYNNLCVLDQEIKKDLVDYKKKDFVNNKTYVDYRKYDWANSEKWNKYLTKLTPVPENDKLEKFRRKWYKKNVCD